MKKRFLALFLTAVLALSVTACGDSGSSAPAGDSAEPVVEEESAEEEAQPEVDPMAVALENINSVDSMEAKMVVEMNMVASADGQEQSVESKMVTDMAWFNDPIKVKMEMTAEAGGEIVEMSIYGEEEEDGTYMMYAYDGTSWQSQQAGAADLEAFSARDSMASSIGDGSVYKAEGTEQLDGANTYKYSYVMEGDETKEAMLSSGALDSVKELGIDSSQLDGMLDGLGEITTYVWIDEATLYPVKYEMDMTDVMQALMVNLVETMGEQVGDMSVDVQKMGIIMTCSNFNNVADFSVPDEAKAN